MYERRIGIIVNGATGRMSRNPQLKRTLFAIRDAGGKYVCCEKPIAKTGAEVRELAGLADGGGMMLEFMPHFCYLLEDLVAPVERMVCKGVNPIPRHGVDVPASGASS